MECKPFSAIRPRLIKCPVVISLQLKTMSYSKWAICCFFSRTASFNNSIFLSMNFVRTTSKFDDQTLMAQTDSVC